MSEEKKTLTELAEENTELTKYCKALGERAKDDIEIEKDIRWLEVQH